MRVPEYAPGGAVTYLLRRQEKVTKEKATPLCVAAARENLSYGTKGTEFMAPPSSAFELMRTAVLGLAVRHPVARALINPRQTSTSAYADSPLNGASDGFAVGPAPGSVLSECPVGDGCLTDLLDTGCTAFYIGEVRDAPEVPCALRALPRAADHTSRLYPMYGASEG